MEISLDLGLDAVVSGPVSASAWSVEEIPPSIRSVERAVEAPGAEHLQRAVVAIFDSEFGYVVLSGLSGRMRFVIREELAAGTVEGLEAIDAVERLPVDVSFSWQGSTGMLNAEGVQAVVSGVMTTDRGRMPLEEGLPSILDALGIRGVALSLDDETVMVTGSEPLPRDRYWLRHGVNLVPVDLIDGDTGDVIATFDRLDAADAEVNRLNGYPYWGSRQPGL